MLSQNVTFSGPVAEDSEWSDPPGMALARQLREGLAKRRWTVGAIEIWRDSGWEIPCVRDEARLEVVILGTDVHAWLGQVYPTDVPGLIRRAFGRRPSASDADLFALAVDVHEILLEGGFNQIRWAWDEYPADGETGPPPAPPIPRATARSS